MMPHDVLLWGRRPALAAGSEGGDVDAAFASRRPCQLEPAKQVDNLVGGHVRAADLREGNRMVHCTTTPETV